MVPVRDADAFAFPGNGSPCPASDRIDRRPFEQVAEAKDGGLSGAAVRPDPSGEAPAARATHMKASSMPGSERV